MNELTYDELVLAIACVKDYQDRCYRAGAATQDTRRDIEMCESILAKLDAQRRRVLQDEFEASEPGPASAFFTATK